VCVQMSTPVSVSYSWAGKSSKAAKSNSASRLAALHRGCRKKAAVWCVSDTHSWRSRSRTWRCSCCTPARWRASSGAWRRWCSRAGAPAGGTAWSPSKRSKQRRRRRRPRGGTGGRTVVARSRGWWVRVSDLVCAGDEGGAHMNRQTNAAWQKSLASEPPRASTPVINPPCACPWTSCRCPRAPCQRCESHHWPGACTGQ